MRPLAVNELSLWVLEKCKACQGTTMLGHAAVALVCETCDGSGMMWVERGFMPYQEDDDEDNDV
jgi:DnaJ-class molecular chaperone